MSLSNPPAEGVRPEWSTMPDAVRFALEGWLGSTVATAESQAGGFSPGIAARICTADGARYFVKGVGPLPNRDSPGMHRREAQIVAAMPDGVAVPRLLWSYDDEETGWVLLVFQDIEGRHPHMPWSLDELDRVMNGLAKLADALTPSPLPISLVGNARGAFSPVDKRLAAACRRAAVRPGPPRSAGRGETWTGSSSWSRRPPRPSTATPCSISTYGPTTSSWRGDKVWLFDWASACVGASWVDAIGFAPSVAMQGGPPPGTGRQSPSSRPLRRTPPHITAAVAAIAGYFTHRALQPPAARPADAPGVPGRPGQGGPRLARATGGPKLARQLRSSEVGLQ